MNPVEQVVSDVGRSLKICHVLLFHKSTRGLAMKLGERLNFEHQSLWESKRFHKRTTRTWNIDRFLGRTLQMSSLISKASNQRLKQGFCFVQSLQQKRVAARKMPQNSTPNYFLKPLKFFALTRSEETHRCSVNTVHQSEREEHLHSEWLFGIKIGCKASKEFRIKTGGWNKKDPISKSNAESVDAPSRSPITTQIIFTVVER